MSRDLRLLPMSGAPGGQSIHAGNSVTDLYRFILKWPGLSLEASQHSRNTLIPGRRGGLVRAGRLMA